MLHSMRPGARQDQGDVSRGYTTSYVFAVRAAPAPPAFRRRIRRVQRMHIASDLPLRGLQQVHDAASYQRDAREEAGRRPVSVLRVRARGMAVPMHGVQGMEVRVGVPGRKT